MRNQFRGFFVHVLPASLPYAIRKAALSSWSLLRNCLCSNEAFGS